MATYLNELRALIASTTTSTEPDGAAPGSSHLEVKLGDVLPKLLRDYVVPSPEGAGKELRVREVSAILKLVAYTALKFPGVFYNGRSADVVSVIARILTFLAEPNFRLSHEIIFQAVWNLLSILRTGDREAYRQFFLDAMVAVEDVLYVASLHDACPSGVPPGRCLVKCLSGSFLAILDTPELYSELPASCRPKNGPGVLVDLTGDARWRPFATSLIKLVNKCLTDGTLYVDGLVNMPFVSAACSILCYADSSLHKVCFDFARIVATVMTPEILPLENMIRSITCILSQDVSGLSEIRDADYDFSMGACLRALHSSCPGYIVESTAADIVNVLQRAVKTSKSAELEVALYTAYKRIIELCSAQVWKPGILLKLLCLPKPCSKLIECIRVVIGKFGETFFTLDDGNGQSSPQTRSKNFELPKAGHKRISHNEEASSAKRQKTTESGFSAGTGFEKEEYGCAFRQSLNLLIKRLSPDNHETYRLDPEIAIEAISLLCISLCVYPKTNLFTRVSKQVLSWIYWIHKQITQRNFYSFDAPLYFEALHTVMLLQFNLPGHTKLLEDDSQLIGDGTHFVHPIYPDLISMLKLMWDGHDVTQSSSNYKITYLLMQIFAKIGNRLNSGCDLEFLDLAIRNGTAEIKNEAIMSLPIIVFYSGPMMLGAVFKKLESVDALGLENVGKSIAFSLGFLSCLNGITDYTDNARNHCKLFLDKHYEQPVSTLDLLLRGFCCSQCDIRNRTVHYEEQISIADIGLLQVENMDFNTNISKAHTLFFKFLYVETSEESIVSLVEILPRILRHSSRRLLLEMRTQWNQCFEFLLRHEMKAVRETFSSVVYCFLENNVMDILFSGGLGMEGGTKALQFMDKIKCAFTETEDFQVLLTLLESIGTIVKVSDIHGEVFFCSFVLLIGQLDNHNSILRMTALRLIHRCCTYCFKGGLNDFLLKYSHARDNLYDHLSSILVTHPVIIKEFSENIVGIKTVELIKRMVPSVIPKLIVSHPNNNHAIFTLRELASHLNTELVPMIVNLLPKVLCFALFYEDGQHLQSVLQFYKNETGTDSKEIFAAALPTLLDEIICFPGEYDQIETDIRIAKISPTIQNIARILTGSETLPEFLRNDFVRLLNSIDKKMLHSGDMKLQKQALQRIRKLVEMMGPYVAQIRIRVSDTIRIGYADTSFSKKQ